MGYLSVKREYILCGDNAKIKSKKNPENNAFLCSFSVQPQSLHINRPLSVLLSYSDLELTQIKSNSSQPQWVICLMRIQQRNNHPLSNILTPQIFTIIVIVCYGTERKILFPLKYWRHLKTECIRLISLISVSLVQTSKASLLSVSAFSLWTAISQ